MDSNEDENWVKRESERRVDWNYVGGLKISYEDGEEHIVIVDDHGFSVTAVPYPDFLGKVEKHPKLPDDATKIRDATSKHRIITEMDIDFRRIDVPKAYISNPEEAE